MKALFTIILLIILGFGAWFFFLKEEPVENPITTPTEEVELVDGAYAVSTSSSSLGWEGSRPLIPGYKDNGTIAIQGGSLEVSGGVITGGSFTIDMGTITAVSTGRGNGEDMLSRHLKSADFFDAENFPTSTFTITNATADGMITGNLTIKGETHPISFPATLSQNGDTITAQAEVEVDRTTWNVRYGSDKFFDNLGNNLIDDTFTLTINLTAERAE